MIRDWRSVPLSRRERRVISALAEALYDEHGPGLDSTMNALLEDVEAWLSAAHAPLRATFRAMLLVLEASPVRFGFGLRAMSRQPLDERSRYLALLDAAGVSSFAVWKSIVGMAYFARPEGLRECTRETAREALVVVRVPRASSHDAQGVTA